MSLDPYAICPCGSGKKFKWCCQPYYAQIEKALTQHANGQHEAAVRTLEQLTEQHPNNPEVWGRLAELLWENNQTVRAEECLDRALALNPQYAFGHFLRGMIRHEEGEIPGALLLYRRALGAAHPEARDLLAEIHVNLGQCQLALGRTLAARAEWEEALKAQPDSEAANRLVQEYFGAECTLPPFVCEMVELMPAPAVATESAWPEALTAARRGDWSAAAAGFEQLVAAEPGDTAAWFNLGLVRAWLGENEQALEAWDQYVEREADEGRAAHAWALAEVLRFARGLENRCDYIEHQAVFQLRDPQPVGKWLGNDPRLADLQQAQGVIAGRMFDREPPPGRDGIALFELSRAAAYLVIVGDRLILSHADRELFDQAVRRVEEILGPALAAPERSERAYSPSQVLSYALNLALPEGIGDEQALRLLRAGYEEYFEGKWMRRPLHALNQIAPVDAVGHPTLRKKVAGIIEFLESLPMTGFPTLYDFDRLRHRLGLPTRRPMSEEPGAKEGDILSMSAAELTGLEPEALSDADLHQAFQSAARLDADALMDRFAREIVGRPPDPERPDRFLHYRQLVQLALEDGESGEAQGLIDAGLAHDGDHNQGRRRNDYELLRARAHLAVKELDQARDAFQRLLDRAGSDLDLCGTATEAMLSAGRRDDATRFAEQGLNQARKKGDRDRTGYFEELLAAARK